MQCGGFKRALPRFRELLGNACSKTFIDFDAFEQYPETGLEADKPFRHRSAEVASISCILADQLLQVLPLKDYVKDEKNAQEYDPYRS